MTIRQTIIEGFDLVSDNTQLLERGWTYADGTLINTGSVTNGKYYELGTSPNNVLSKVSGYGNYTRMAFWFKGSNLQNNEGQICRLQMRADPVDNNLSAAYHLFYLEYNLNGSLTLRGSMYNVNHVTTQTNLLQNDTWHHIEFLVKISSAGWVDIKVDGVLVADRSVTAGSYYSTSGADYSSPSFHGSATTTHCFDDIYIRLATTEAEVQDWLAPHKIHTLMTSADTATADFTGSYTDLQVNDGDTSCITGNTTNQESKFEIDSLSETPSVIHGVQVSSVTKKSDAGIRAFKATITSNGVAAEGTEFAPNQFYDGQASLFEINPDTGLPFTAQEINALQVGVKITQ